jgi:hypothetical protein
LARMIPSGAIVFCDQSGFAAPLRFLYSIDAYEVYRGRSCSEFIWSNRQELSRLQKKVYILTMREQVATSDMTLRKMGQATLASHIQIQPKYSVPDQLKGRGGHFVLYAVELLSKKDKAGQDLELHDVIERE